MIVTTGWYLLTADDLRTTVSTLASGTSTEYHIEWKPAEPRQLGTGH